MAPHNHDTDRRPPAGALWLLRRCVRAHQQEEIADDLDELFQSRILHEGARRARWLYWKDVLSLCLFRSRRNEYDYITPGTAAMLINYLKIAFRTYWRNKAYSIINVLGLAVGMACCLLILLYVQDERSYDRFHERADRIYRLERVVEGQAAVASRHASTASAMGPTLMADVPGIEQVTRFMTPFGERLIRHGDERFYEDGFLWADASVFEVFSFPLLRGDPRTALRDPYSIVITPAIAEKYFGEDDPMGRVLTVQGSVPEEYTVTGLLAEIPATSHLRFDFLASMSSKDRPEGDMPFFFSGQGAWDNNPFYTYVVLAEGTTPETVARQFPAFSETYMGEIARARNSTFGLHIEPLPNLYLRSEAQPSGAHVRSSDARYIYIFSSIALFVLLIGCINFMNLATARSAGRSREVGLRKVVGARRAQLIQQFLGESVLVAVSASLLALGLSAAALPVFNDLTEKQLSLLTVGQPTLLLGIIAVAVLVGLLAGSYPALFLSAFRPIQVLKERLGRKGGHGYLRQGLVVFQFAITIIMMMGTGVVFQQMSFMKNKNLGFDKEQVVVIPLRDEAARRGYATIKRSLMQHPNVTHASVSAGVPGRNFLADSWPVLPEGAPEEQKQYMLANMIDFDYLDTFGIDVVAGRGFSEDIATDSTAAFMINEAAVAALGWASPQQALGKRLHWQQGAGKEGTIIGVVQDHHVRSLHEPIEPLLLHIFPERFVSLSARVRPDDVAGTLSFLEQQWGLLSPDYPFEYFFLDEEFDAKYAFEARLSRLFGYAAGLTMLIACLGLFGLAAFTADQRTKEIGIRKVLGASASNIVLLLSKDLTRLVGLAFVLAAPMGYLAMDRWLQDFAYRIDISWGIVLLVGLTALGTALLTVGYQALKAALANPIKSLRHE